jgi:hypothetical protein
MSVLIAGRSGALAVLMVISFFGAGAQQKMPPTLRERAAKRGACPCGSDRGLRRRMLCRFG